MKTLAILFALSVSAFSQTIPFAIRLSQLNTAGNSTITTSHPYPPTGTRAFAVYNPDTSPPSAHITVFGSDFSWDVGSPNRTLNLSTVFWDTIDASLDEKMSVTDAETAIDSMQGQIDAINSGAFSGAYSDLTGKPSLFDGDYANLSNKPSLFSGSYGDLTSVPTTFTPAAHNQAWSTITSTPTSLSGYGIADPVVLTSGGYADPAWVTSLAYSKLTGTPTIPTNTNQLTNGSGFIDSSSLSGYATSSALTSGLAGKLDTPAGTASQYLRGDGSLAAFPSLTSGTVTSVVAGTGLSGGTITSTGTISLPNTGTAGTYSGVTTDAQGRVTAGTTLSFTNNPTRAIQAVAAAANGWQIDASRNSEVSYSVTISCAVQIGLATNVEGYVVMEVASTNSSTAANWQEIDRTTNGQNIALAIALSSTQKSGASLRGTVPAGYYVRIRSVNVAGTPTYTFNSGQEVKL